MRYHASDRVASTSSRGNFIPFLGIQVADQTCLLFIYFRCLVTLAQHMRTLFRIAVTNFVVPAMFSIAQFVCAYRNVNALVLNQVILVNTMVSTFGVAFATVWAGSVSRQRVQVQESYRKYTTSRLMSIFGTGSGRVANQSSTVMIAPPPGYTQNSQNEIKM